MILTRLQKLTAKLFARCSALAGRAGAWIRKRPGLAAWIFPADARAPAGRYRDFNGWCFGHFSEQEKMLADPARMDFYHAMINRQVQPGDEVIDLGTGTGILAAFAARRGAARVHALDHSRILEQARALAAHNHLQRVEFVATHSGEFKLDHKVDVIVHEQMGDFLFDEEMVANVTDLRDRLLKPGGRILPAQFEFFCEPVKIRDDRRVPFLWNLNVHGYDYSCLASQQPSDPGYYRMASSDQGVIEHFLGEPAPLQTVDLHTVVEDDLPCDLTQVRQVRNPGRLDGFAVFFRARAEELELTTNPLDKRRAPHWGFHLLRVEAEHFSIGEGVEFNLRVGRWPEPDTWRWDYRRLPAGPAIEPRPAEAYRPW